MGLIADSDIKPANEPAWLSEPCRDCNAKPGELCASLVDASKYRREPHARRAGERVQGG